MELYVWLQNLQWVLAASKYYSSKNLRNRFVLLDSGSDRNAKLWVASVMLLFRMHVEDCEEEKVSTFMQYIYVSPLLDNMDRALRCAYLPWATDGGIYCSLAQSDPSPEVQKLKTAVWFVVVLFGSI